MCCLLSFLILLFLSQLVVYVARGFKSYFRTILFCFQNASYTLPLHMRMQEFFDDHIIIIFEMTHKPHSCSDTSHSHRKTGVFW